jgi:hypothetical protein
MRVDAQILRVPTAEHVAASAYAGSPSVEMDQGASINKAGPLRQLCHIEAI